MQEIVPGSIYSQLNIQEGDMITGINGKKITNMAELMNLFGQIDKIDHFELSLSRDGVEQNLEYDFE
jgi:type II secretory pathway component PulC